MDKSITDKNAQIIKLYNKVISTFPDIKTQLKEQEFVMSDFPLNKFKAIVTYRIHIKRSDKEEFDFFKGKVEKALTEKFPDIRFYWKYNEVYIYTEEYSSGIYVTNNNYEGFSVKFLEILETLFKVLA